MRHLTIQHSGLTTMLQARHYPSLFCSFCFEVGLLVMDFWLSTFFFNLEVGIVSTAIYLPSQCISYYACSVYVGMLTYAHWRGNRNLHKCQKLCCQLTGLPATGMHHAQPGLEVLQLKRLSAPAARLQGEAVVSQPRECMECPYSGEPLS